MLQLHLPAPGSPSDIGNRHEQGPRLPDNMPSRRRSRGSWHAGEGVHPLAPPPPPPVPPAPRVPPEYLGEYLDGLDAAKKAKREAAQEAGGPQPTAFGMGTHETKEGPGEDSEAHCHWQPQSQSPTLSSDGVPYYPNPRESRKKRQQRANERKIWELYFAEQERQWQENVGAAAVQLPEEVDRRLWEMHWAEMAEQAAAAEAQEGQEAQDGCESEAGAAGTAAAAAEPVELEAAAGVEQQQEWDWKWDWGAASQAGGAGDANYTLGGATTAAGCYSSSSGSSSSSADFFGSWASSSFNPNAPVFQPAGGGGVAAFPDASSDGDRAGLEMKEEVKVSQTAPQEEAEQTAQEVHDRGHDHAEQQPAQPCDNAKTESEEVLGEEALSEEALRRRKKNKRNPRRELTVEKYHNDDGMVVFSL